MTGKHIGRGGMETVIKLLSKELIAQNHQTILYSVLPMDFPDIYSSFSKTVISDVIPKWLQTKRFFRPRLLYSFYKNLAINNLADIQIQDNLDALLLLDNNKGTIKAFNTLAYLRKKSPKTKVFFYPHGTLKRVMKKSSIKKFVSNTDGALAISSGIQSELDTISRQLGSPRPIHTIYNPVPLAPLMPRPLKGVRLVFIGRMDKNKRIIELLRIVSHLKGDWTLDIVGDAPSPHYKKEIVRALQKYNLNKHVRLHGWQAQPWNVFDNASVTLLHSRSEGLPLVLIESIMRGIPCVAADCPTGPADIIQDGYNGWLYPVNDETKAQQILQEIIDGVRLLPSPNDVHATAAKFSADKVIERLLLAIESTPLENPSTEN